MLIAACILAYILFGLLVYGGMVIMSNKGIDFNLRDRFDEDISTTFVLTILVSPVVLLLIYPYVIFDYYIKK